MKTLRRLSRWALAAVAVLLMIMVTTQDSEGKDMMRRGQEASVQQNAPTPFPPDVGGRDSGSAEVVASSVTVSGTVRYWDGGAQLPAAGAKIYLLQWPSLPWPSVEAPAVVFADAEGKYAFPPYMLPAQVHLAIWPTRQP